MKNNLILVVGAVIIAYYILFKKETKSNNATNILIKPDIKSGETILQQQVHQQYIVTSQVYEKYNNQCRLLCVQTGGKYTPFQFDFKQGKWIGGYCSTTAGQVAIDTYLKQQLTSATSGRG